MVATLLQLALERPIEITKILKDSEISSDAEFSFEAHPNNTTEAHLKELYSLGFRRVSFGIQDFDEKVQKDQILFLNKVRSQRDNLAVNEKLALLKKASEGTDNLMPYIIDAVKVYTSLGEICNTLRDVYGEYKEHVVI